MQLYTSLSVAGLGIVLIFTRMNQNRKIGIWSEIIINLIKVEWPGLPYHCAAIIYLTLSFRIFRSIHVESTSHNSRDNNDRISAAIVAENFSHILLSGRDGPYDSFWIAAANRVGIHSERTAAIPKVNRRGILPMRSIGAGNTHTLHLGLSRFRDDALQILAFSAGMIAVNLIL